MRLWPRKFRLSLFGPVLFYDLVRDGRRARGLWLRCAYAALLLGVLCWLYASWFSTGAGWENLFASRSARPEELPRFAERFFSTFMMVQYAVVLLLTPAYTAGAIAEEKENKTLEYLLATDLSSQEIVFDKLLSRLGRLLLLLLTGVPVLALTPFWGGVDPKLVLAGFAATGVTVLSLAALSIVNSVYARRPTDAVLRTYFQVGVFLIFGGCIPGPNLGHPVVALTLLAESWGSAGSQGTSLVVVLGGYSLVHLIVAAVCIIIAAGNLRRVALGVLARPERPSPRRYRQRPNVTIPSPAVQPAAIQYAPPPSFWPSPRRLPLMGDNPLLWKEMYLDQHFTWDRVHPVLAMLLIFAGVVAASIGLTVVLVPLAANNSPGFSVNWWLRVVGTAVALGLWLVQGFYAAVAVSRERERHTLDGLLTLPEGREGVLFAKWLGNVLSTRQSWWCPGAIWVWGVLTGGLHVLSFPLVLLGWAVVTAFVASLGLYCSTLSTTTLRAILRTFLALLALVLGTWLLASGAETLAAALPPWLAGPFQLFAEYGLPLPLPLVVLAFRYDTSWEINDLSSPEILLAALAGLLFYAALAWLLWRLALRAFRKRG